MMDFTLWRVGYPKITLQAAGTSTTRKSTSRLLDLVLSQKRTGRQIIPVGFTSFPPKPRIGFTKGTISRLGCTGFSQAIPRYDVHEAAVSIRIHCTITLAIFISMTRGSLWGEANRGASLPPNTIVGAAKQGPSSAVSTRCAFLS